MSTGEVYEVEPAPEQRAYVARLLARKQALIRSLTAGVPAPTLSFAEIQALAGREQADAGWMRVGVDRWRRHYGAGVVGEVYTVAAGLFTGGIRALFGDDLAHGTNYGNPAGQVVACVAVDAMREAHRGRLFQAERYLASVVSWLDGSGYHVADQFVEGDGAFDHPDHVIEVDLDGPIAHLIWDTQSWRVIIYPKRGSGHDDELSVKLPDPADILPRNLLRLVRLLLDEAARRYGSSL